jgi:hypothetical protein
LEGPANATYNRGKRSIVLDLKSPGDFETARKLVASADVVIENFRPGTMARLGLGAEAMTREHARLIYCSMPGFAATDPRAGVAAWEGTIAAATVTYPANAQTGRPTFTPLPFSSSYAAFLAAVSVAMALNARERTASARAESLSRRHHIALSASQPVRICGTPSHGRHAPVECKDGRWFMYHAGNSTPRTSPTRRGEFTPLPGSPPPSS